MAYNPYDEIAPEWQLYRSGTSSVLPLFIKLVPQKGVVLDAGCGHGRNHAKILEKAAFLYAVDSSRQVVKLARQNAVKNGLEKKTRIGYASIAHLPLQNESVDAVLCKAVLHHLRTPVARRKALREFHRVLKKGGFAFVCVWNFYQKRFEKLGKKRSTLVDWKLKNGRVAKRFYHFFEKDELLKYAKEAGFTVETAFFETNGVERERQGADDLCAILRKRQALR